MDLNININIDLSERTEKVIEDFVGTVMAMRSGVVMVAEPHLPDELKAKILSMENVTRKKGEETTEAQKPNLEESKKPRAKKKAEQTPKEEAIAPETIEATHEKPEAIEATQKETPAVEEAPLFNEPEPTPEETQVPTLQPKDVRDAMERIREKFGDVIKDGEQVNPDLHRSLTRCFKAIASAMGFEKPSAIDNPAKRWEFVGALDGIRVEDNKACPF